jgi:spermidine/putrescine transport system ATP-binding protein
LEVRKGEFFSLLGPSGCGKTTLLRIIAAFENSDAGELSISGRKMAGVSPQERSVNTVFQNYALFPHLNVFDNVAFGLRMKKKPIEEIKQRVEKALDLVRIGELRARFPNEISGGQKQRVALSRALVNEPEVLLLDEPLAAIDAKLRAQLQSELKNLQRTLGTTFIYVTHDQDEALALSDRIAVMQSGRIEQVGTPHEIYRTPRNRFVAGFVGACNLFDATLSNDSLAQTSIGPLTLRPDRNPNPALSLAIRRENIHLSSSPHNENTFRGTIQDISFHGPQTSYTIQVNGVLLRATESGAAEQYIRGTAVYVTLPPEHLLILEP